MSKFCLSSISKVIGSDELVNRVVSSAYITHLHFTESGLVWPQKCCQKISDSYTDITWRSNLHILKKIKSLYRRWEKQTKETKKLRYSYCTRLILVPLSKVYSSQVLGPNESFQILFIWVKHIDFPIGDLHVSLWRVYLVVCPLYYRGFSCDVISSQFCKSSYSRPPCWFPIAWAMAGYIGKYNKMSRYFLFSSYHNTKSRPNDTSQI